MKHKLIALITFVALVFVGCGDSDTFVFTDNNNNNNNAVAGVAAQLAFVTNPAQQVNTDFSTAPIVEVQDASGNRVFGDTSEITVSLVNPGGATLNGQTTRNAVDGRAVFTGLSVDQAGSFTLQATSGNLQAGSSSTFVVQRLALYIAHRDSASFGSIAPSTLVELDPSNGSTVGSLGQIGDGTVFGAITGIECLPDGTLLGVAVDVTDADRHLLLRISPTDPTNGTTVIGEINNNVVDRIHEITYDSENQVLYGSANRVNGPNDIDFFILTINTSTGAGTLLTNPTFNETNQIGFSIVYDVGTDTLFAMRAAGNVINPDDELHSINTTPGAATLIGMSPFPANNNVIAVSGLDVNPTDGNLYYCTRSGALGPSDFGQINTTTGAKTVDGTSVNASSMTFCENAPVAPATGTL